LLGCAQGPFRLAALDDLLAVAAVGADEDDDAGEQ